MIRLLVWLIVVILALVLVTFAATNHHWTTVDFWPSDFSLRVPAVALLFVGLAVGFLVGLFVSWIAGGRTRREARRQRREVKRLTDRLERQTGTTPAPR